MVFVTFDPFHLHRIAEGLAGISDEDLAEVSRIVRGAVKGRTEAECWDALREEWPDLEGEALSKIALGWREIVTRAVALSRQKADDVGPEAILRRYCHAIARNVVRDFHRKQYSAKAARQEGRLRPPPELPCPSCGCNATRERRDHGGRRALYRYRCPRCGLAFQWAPERIETPRRVGGTYREGVFSPDDASCEEDPESWAEKHADQLRQLVDDYQRKGEAVGARNNGFEGFADQLLFLLNRDEIDDEDETEEGVGPDGPLSLPEPLKVLEPDEADRFIESLGLSPRLTQALKTLWRAKPSSSDESERRPPSLKELASLWRVTPQYACKVRKDVCTAVREALAERSRQQLLELERQQASLARARAPLDEWDHLAGQPDRPRGVNWAIRNPALYDDSWRGRSGRYPNGFSASEFARLRRR